MEPIRDLKTFYEAIPILAQKLRAAGALSDAENLDNLMNAFWTTGSELLGELALTLEPMCNEYSGDLQSLIKECLHFARHHRRILELD